MVRKESRLTKRLNNLGKIDDTDKKEEVRDRIQKRLGNLNEKENNLLAKMQERQQKRDKNKMNETEDGSED
jgi:hypothetical protein